MADDFFGELGKSISRATQQAVDKTNVFIERTKLSAQITGEQKEIERLYQILGEAAYQRIRAGKIIPDAQLQEIVNEINSCAGQMSAYKKDLADVRNMKICARCGAVIAMDAAFCPKCGAPV